MNTDKDKPVQGFCVKCNELYNVPDFMQDIIFPICPPCYRKIFTTARESIKTRMAMYQSSSPQPVQSSFC